MHHIASSFVTMLLSHTLIIIIFNETLTHTRQEIKAKPHTTYGVRFGSNVLVHWIQRDVDM